MYLSKTELEIIKHLPEQLTNKQLAQTLHKDQSQISRLTTKLQNNNILLKQHKHLQAATHPHAQLLIRVLQETPQLKEHLHTSGIEILINLQTPKTVEELTQDTNKKKSTIYHWLAKAQQRSVITKDANTYQLNKKLWPKLAELIQQITTYEKNYDPRTPPGATIYHKNNQEILFSTKKQTNATKTAFSAFSDHEITIYPKDNTYYLPKKKLSKKEILKHALIRTQQEPTAQNIILTALFAHKHNIHEKHEILLNVQKILEGETIQNYPTKQEIQEKAQLYDIKL